jgi:hypothetical protein
MWWLALAAWAREPDEARIERRSLLPPVRLDLGMSLREAVAPAFVARLGVQVARTERFRFDANAAYQAPRALYTPGVWRQMRAWEFSADATYAANRFFSIGPTVGLVYRLYHQQWQLIDDSATPIAGLRANLGLVTTRRWGLVLVARGTLDVDTTRFVLANAEVVTLPPLDGQLALHVDFGHGRVPARPGEDR